MNFYISSAINLIKVRQNIQVQLPNTKKEPANKHIQRQRPFVSTRKKKKQANVRIKKPTATEKEEICNALLEKSRSLYNHEQKDLNVLLPKDKISKHNTYMYLEYCVQIPVTINHDRGLQFFVRNASLPM